MRKCLLICFFPAFLFCLEINIISPGGKFGLSSDVTVLEKELTALGHKVYTHRPDKVKGKKVDINVHVQDGTLKALPFATKNYLLPNPDWYKASVLSISQFDLILCKTREAEKIYKNINPKTKYISFTTEDRYDANEEKNLRSLIHLASTSILKGTAILLKAWEANPKLPTLTLINPKAKTFQILPNVETIDYYLPLQELVALQNQFGIHICPSETEGFGHYIFEALSCGAVVVTTDAPPMNEFITDPRCLASYSSVMRWRMARRYAVDPQSLVDAVENLLLLPDEELIKIGEQNRIFYLQNDQFFKDSLREVFGSALTPSYAHSKQEMQSDYPAWGLRGQ